MPKLTGLDAVALCAAPNCSDTPMPLAPFPLCAHHVREVYEFAQSVVDVRWRTATAMVAHEDRGQRPIPPTLDTMGWVYFVRIGDKIKIGYSTYPEARFKGLRPDEILALVPGTMQDERRCHAAFQHLRAHGEYFEPGRDLLDFIEDLKHAA